MADINVIYKETNGLKLPMEVYMPTDENKTDIAIVCIHGGGWQGAIKDNSEWDGCWLRSQAIHFAKQGFVGINISYRSIDFSEDIDVYDLIEDCADAIRYIKNNFDFVNKDKIILFGESAGGHLASCLGVSEDDSIRPYMVIACNPVLDCTREKWHYSAKEEEKRINASPVKLEIKKASDFLFLHGTDDTVAEPCDTIEFHNKLLKKGISSELIMIEGAKHAFILQGYESSDEQVEGYRAKIDKYLKNHTKIT